jgi:hypothetical protein
LTTYNPVYKRIDNYVRSKLSLDYLLNESNEFERIKAFLFDSNELYVLENINRLKCKVFNSKDKEAFETEKFKRCYLEVQKNKKLFTAIG